MSYIGHTCTCGHSDLNHEHYLTSPLCKASPCPRPCSVEPESTLRPTFDDKGNSIERIVPPGQKLGAGLLGARVRADNGGHTYTDAIGGPETCDCDECRALYAELTGEAA